MMFKVLLVLAIAAVPGMEGVEDDDVKYFLYTNINRDDAIELNPEEGRSISLIADGKSVKILCHGFTDNSSSFWIQPTKDAFINSGEKNIISIDWSKHAFGLYTSAYSKARAIGQHVADLVMTLSTNHDIPLSKFHLIGHSLGSHISAFAGKTIYERTGNKLGRITGLDPAGPLFSEKDTKNRLTPDDATFVDAIHTDTTIFGYKKPLAHVDFWPNGGKSQKGCSLLSNCSHCRAPMYFYESINSTRFTAWKCDSIKQFNDGECFDNGSVVMGDGCDPKARGNFYLNTNKASPFGMHV